MLQNKKRIVSLILMLALMITTLVVTTISAYAADNVADLNTLATNTSYTTRTTTSGWVATNSATAKSAMTSQNVAVILNGKKTAKGTLTSPTLSNGISELSFGYAYIYSESKGVNATINIKDTSGNVVATDSLVVSSITQNTAYTYTWKLSTPVTGNFVIEILNNGPSNSTSNKDRLSIWNVTWVSNIGGGTTPEEPDTPTCDHADCTYTPNIDGKHTVTCNNADCAYTVDEACTGGTATCVVAAVCEKCEASYGEVDSSNHDYDSTNGTCNNGCGTTAPKATFVVPAGVEPIADWYGTKVTFPSADAPEGYTFKGWVEATVDNTTTEPGSYKKAGNTQTLDLKGNTFYALYSYSVGGSDGYVKKNIAEITSTDTVIITMTTSGGTTYALSSSNGSSSAPAAVIVKVDGNNVVASDTSALVWNIKTTNDGYIIYVAGSETTWLYCTNDNNGVRVGTNTANVFTISGNYLKHTGTGRYVGVYTTNPDWRCYANTTGNIANQTLAFYVGEAGTTYYTTVIDEVKCSHDDCTFTSNNDGTHTVECNNSDCNYYLESVSCTGGEATCQSGAVCEYCEAEYTDVKNHNYVDGKCTVCETPAPDVSGRYYIAVDRNGYWYITSLVEDSRYQAERVSTNVLPESISCRTTNCVFVLVRNDDGTYCIYAEGVEGDEKYLGWTSGNSGKLVAEDEALNLYVDCKEDGTYNIHFKVSDEEERYLSLNNTEGNNYFAFYKGTQKQDLKLIPVEDHTPGAEADCTNAQTCKVCGVKLNPALGHDLVDINGKDATCTEDGYTAYKDCSRCDYIEGKETISATGHVNTTTTTVAAKCETDGYTKVTCSCGHVVSNVVILATGHSYNEGVVTTDPTCTKDGVKTYTCENDANHKYTETVAALGHYLVDVEGKEATCIEDGYTAYKDCSRCDYIEGKEVVPATDHAWDNNCDTTCNNNCGETREPSHTAVTSSKAPTCTTGGFNRTDCSVCQANLYYSEVEALGHKFETYISDNNATCTVDGTKTATCTRCSETDTVTDEGSATGHNMVAGKVVAPTFDDEGYTVYTCANGCHNTENRDIVPALVAVAAVNGVKYESLQEAFDAAVSDDVITLLANVAADKYIDIKTANNGEVARTLTLDLNGKTISPAEGYNYNSGYPLVYVGINQTLYIKGEGTITADKKVTVGVYGTLHVEGGNIVNTGTTDNDAALDIYYWNHDLPSYEGIVGGTGYIDGGNFIGTVYVDEPDEDGHATLVISGGTFTHDVSEYCVDGSFTQKNENGIYAPVSFVVRIGNTKYDSLEAAIAAAKNGDVIALGADAFVAETLVVNAKITIDTNGNTITLAEGVYVEITSKGALTIGNSTVSGNEIRYSGKQIRYMESDNKTVKTDYTKVDIRLLFQIDGVVAAEDNQAWGWYYRFGSETNKWNILYGTNRNSENGQANVIFANIGLNNMENNVTVYMFKNVKVNDVNVRVVSDVKVFTAADVLEAFVAKYADTTEVGAYARNVLAELKAFKTNKEQATEAKLGKED